MKRVAIPISKGRLSEYFGQCNHYEIFEIDGKNITSNSLEVPPFHDIDKLPAWVAAQGITDVITYRVDRRIISLFASEKVNLFVGVTIDRPEILIENYLNGTLKSNSDIINEITRYD